MKEQIVFYTTNCSRCKILKKKLDDKHVPYKKVQGEDAVKAITEAGQNSAPMLKVNGENKDFGEAIKWVNKLCR